MTCKVKINKETGLSADGIPVYDQNNNHVLEGDVVCEKVWQYYYKSQIIDSGIWSDFDVECSQNSKADTRQIYRVVKQEEAGTVEDVRDAALVEMGVDYEPHISQTDQSFVQGAIFGANFQKSKTIDEVISIIRKAVHAKMSADVEIYLANYLIEEIEKLRS